MAIYDINGNVMSQDATKQKSRTITNPNLADPSLFTVGLLNSDGTINTKQIGCRTTDFISCFAGDVLSVGIIKAYVHNPFCETTSYREGCRAMIFYNESKGIVSADTAGYHYADNTMTGIVAPANTAFVRVSFGGAYISTNDRGENFVHISDEPVTNPVVFVKNGIETIIADDSQLWDHWGKTWVLFGDSLTDSYGGHSWDESTSPVGGIGWKDTSDRVPWTGYFWASDIARKHGYVLDNRAKSGSNIYVSRVYTDVSGKYILDNFITELQAGTIEEPDLITIGFGANSVSDEKGTNADTSETTNTLYGGTKYFIETLNEYCPHARKVYILTPLQSGWRDTSGTLRAAMKEVFDEYNVEYIDMSSHSGITVDMLPDSLHVSSIEANKQYRRFLESYLF